jgi:nicotinate phosphoribosyltransferase
LVTGNPEAALDGVYKLSFFDGKATIKVSENIAKMTLPGIKTIHRFINDEDQFQADGIAFSNEPDYPVIYHLTEPKKHYLDKNLKKETLMHPVMEKGKRLEADYNPSEVASYHLKRLQQLPEGHKRFLNPQVYLTGITEQVMLTRNRLAGQFLKKDIF